MPTDAPDDVGIFIKLFMKHPEVSEESFDNVHTQWIKSHYISEGTKSLLRGDVDAARCNAFLGYIFEILFELHQGKGSMKIPKLYELCFADKRTLCSFYRNRIPCSCLDKMYREVKSSIKFKFGACHNSYCTKDVIDKRTTMFCSICRQSTYCSRECQEEDWPRHKLNCSFMKDHFSKDHFSERR